MKNTKAKQETVENIPSFEATREARDAHAYYRFPDFVDSEKPSASGHRRLNTQEAAAFLAATGTPFTVGTLQVWRCHGKGPKFYKVHGRAFYEVIDLWHFSRGQVVETTDSMVERQ